MSWWIGEHGTQPARVNRWHPGDPDPVALLNHIHGGGKVVAHNAAFERTAWPFLRRRYAPHWPAVSLEQWCCTMSRCAVLAIPQSLEFAAKVFKLPFQKDKEGHNLMMRMARPRKVGACISCDATGFFIGPFDGEKCPACSGTKEEYTWWDDPERVERIGSYCDMDVMTEIGVDNTVPQLSERERRVWELDQIINDRGVQLDVPLIERALATIEYSTAQLNAEMARITCGAVPKITNTAKLAAWITSRGIPCKSVAKGEQDELVTLAAFDGLDDVAYALELRQQAKSSTAKYKAMMACVGADGRARGLLQYHGAATGRWAGRLIQPQNLYRVDPERDGNDIQRAVDILLAHHDPRDVHTVLDVVMCSMNPKTGALENAPMVMLAKCIRTMIIAAPGHHLIGGDSSNIEGRVAAWMTGEDWKVKAFKDYDAGRGPDLYCVAYARSFGGEASEVRGMRRQVGKVSELAFQYQGSSSAFVKMAKNYGVKAGDIVEPVQTATPVERWEAVAKRYHWKGMQKYGLTQEEWTAIKITVEGWRAGHPNLVQGWWDLQDASIQAVTEPETVVPVFGGRVRYMFARNFLWCSLPSNRLLAYFNPRLVTRDASYWVMPDGERIPAEEVGAWKEDTLKALGGEFVKRTRRAIEYEGYESETKQWIENLTLFGGKQFNEIVQGTARDTLVDFMFEAERRGYPITLTVHDEILVEAPIGHGSAEELREIMQTNSPWNVGLPLASKTWAGSRYEK